MENNKDAIKEFNVDLNEYHNVIWLIIEQAFEKCQSLSKLKMAERFNELLEK